MSIPNYLLFPLEDHHSSTFVPSGQEFSRRVELNCGYDVSWKRGIEDDILELQEFPISNLHWDNENGMRIEPCGSRFTSDHPYPLGVGTLECTWKRERRNFHICLQLGCPREHMSPFYCHKCIFIVVSITVANEQTFCILKSCVLYNIYKTNMYTTF